jgi:hypothetical protein
MPTKAGTHKPDERDGLLGEAAEDNVNPKELMLLRPLRSKPLRPHQIAITRVNAHEDGMKLSHKARLQ